MDEPFKRIIKTAIVLIVVAFLFMGIAYFAYRPASAPGPIDTARDGAVNTFLDVSGFKTRLDTELHDKASLLAERTGIPEESIIEVADGLQIKEWKVATLPKSAVETNTQSIESETISAKLTTYEDPTLVTITAYGIPITLEIPESAQPYLQYEEILSQLK